jgi:hypothetical protein
MKLKIPSTKLESRIRAFCGELIAKEITFKLASYLGGEWSCLKGSATRERLERASVCVTGALHLKKATGKRSKLACSALFHCEINVLH